MKDVQTLITDLRMEHDELKDKKTDLLAFLLLHHDELPKTQLKFMEIQDRTMAAYAGVLDARIADLEAQDAQNP